MLKYFNTAFSVLTYEGKQCRNQVSYELTLISKAHPSDEEPTEFAANTNALSHKTNTLEFPVLTSGIRLRPTQWSPDGIALAFMVHAYGNNMFYFMTLLHINLRFTI